MKKDTCKALISWFRVKLYHFHPCKRLLYQWFIGKTLTQFHKSCEYICVCGSWYFFPILVKNVSIFHTGHPLFTDSWPHNLNSVHCDCVLTLFWPQKKPQGIILHLESWFAAGSECKNRWKGPTLPRIANFCPSSQTLFLSRVKPYLSDLFAHFDTFFPRVYRLFLTFSLRIEWACVLVFVERFLV